MTRDETKNLIVEKIEAMQGMKSTELASVPEIVLAGFDLPELFDELLQEGRIVEIEYSVPTLAWRAKSFYLPGGSSVTIYGKGSEPLSK